MPRSSRMDFFGANGREAVDGSDRRFGGRLAEDVMQEQSKEPASKHRDSRISRDAPG